MRLTKWAGYAGALALTATLLMGGCASKKDDGLITAKDVRGKTPELHTVRYSKGQMKNRNARVVNSWERSMRTDFLRIFLFEHNTRLTEPTLP